MNLRRRRVHDLIQLRGGHRRSGLTMLELLVAVAILLVAILNTVAAAVSCSTLRGATADYVKAHNASRAVLETIRNGNLVAEYQAYAAAPNFVVDGQNVSVTFPVSLLTPVYGGPPPATARFLDLNGDGQVDLNAASVENGSLLPVRITVTRGRLKFRLDSLVTEKQ
jgi:prepilin-type N-terminal cleavage/methylation domain-containing protein